MTKRQPNGITLLCILLLFMAAVPGLAAAQDRITVPDVVGEPLSEARTTLQGAGLLIGTLSRSYSETTPKDSVISQSPVAGRLVLPGSAVSLLISDGPPPPEVGTAMVDVAGLLLNDAQTELALAGFALGEVIRTTSPVVPLGYVIDQFPTPGTVSLPGTLVDLLLSMGPQMVVLPNVVGKTIDAAETTLALAGVSLGEVAQEFSNTVEFGVVIGQHPAAGSVVAEGSLIDMTVSAGPGGGLISVPDIVGMPLAGAEQDLLDVSLVIGSITQERNPGVPAGDVLRQDPTGGTSVVAGTLVDLVISSGDSNSIGNLENPASGAYKSGIDVISGWYCDAQRIVVVLSGPSLTLPVQLVPPYGGTRNDTEMLCGDTDNGFGITLNYNRLGNGAFVLQAFADGFEFARRTFHITTFGSEFLRGAAGSYWLDGFPEAGAKTQVLWDQAIQNFAIKSTVGAAGSD